MALLVSGYAPPLPNVGLVPLFDLFGGGTYARVSPESVPVGPGWAWEQVIIKAANERRIWDPGHGLGPMLLIEQPSSQLQINTSDFTGWTKTATTAVDGNVFTAPDGSLTGDRIRATAGGAECAISRVIGSSVKPYQIWQGWLRADTSATASLEASASGSVTSVVDIDLPTNGAWKIYRIIILSTTAVPTWKIRPHKSGALPNSGDAIGVWGGNSYGNSQNSTSHIGSYTPGNNPATSRPSEQLDYISGEYDSRILNQPSWHYWLPLFMWDGTWGDGGGPPDRYGGDTAFTSFGGAANECLWANSDTGTNNAAGAVRVRAENGPSNTRCLTTPLTFSEHQLMVVQRRPDLGLVSVLGATAGGSSVLVSPGGSVVQFNQPWTWPASTLRIGGRADEGVGGQHGLDGLISPVYLGVYNGPLIVAS